VAKVAGVLLEEMNEDPTWIDVLAVAQSATGYCQVGPRQGAGVGGDHLGLVRGDVSCRRHGVDVVEVTVRVGRRAVVVRYLASSPLGSGTWPLSIGKHLDGRESELLDNL